jgi:hypothetical protein
MMPRVGLEVTQQTANIQGTALVYGNDADAILLRSRLAVAVFIFLLFGLMFEAGSRMLGVGPAVIAVALALFEPNLLANATLVTTDMGLCCLLFGSVYAFWRVAEHPSAVRLAGCGVVAGLAFAVKHSALLLIPILAALTAVEISYHIKKASPEGGSFSPRALVRETGIWLARLSVIAGIALRPASSPLFSTNICSNYRLAPRRPDARR